MEQMRVIFDDSALIAAGRGNLKASWLIAQAHPESHREQRGADGLQQQPIARLYAAACALVEADRSRTGTGEHIAALPNLEVVPLDLAAALSIMGATEWSVAHTLYAAQPSPEIPNGALVATTRPERWRGLPVRVLDLNP